MIKPMKAEEFAQYLVQEIKKPGDTVSFANDPGYKWPDEVPIEENCSGWYFVEMIYDRGKDSKYLLFDYFGGGRTMTMALDPWEEGLENISLEWLAKNIKTFFENTDIGKDEYVFVDSITEHENVSNHQKYKNLLADNFDITFFINCIDAITSGTDEDKQIIVDTCNTYLNMFKTDAVCPRCGKQLYLSDLTEYTYLCLDCQENFYENEIRK